MKRVRITMEYTGRSQAEFEVTDDWQAGNSLHDLTDDMLRTLDENLVELSPTDWSVDEVDDAEA